MDIGVSHPFHEETVKRMGHPAAASFCKEEITQQRTKFLRDYFAEDN
jgi:hypothetical protein